MHKVYLLLRRHGRSARAALAVIPILAILAQGSIALAGTTGSLSGTVNDIQPSSTRPLPNAKVTVTSPAQTASTTTDAGGHFTFASLAPDSYTISIEREGFDPIARAGITVIADNNQTLSLTTQRSLRTIGRVTSRSNTDLVRPGTTSDVYSVTGAVAGASQTLGGGFSQDQAYSQIASVPGAYVPTGLIGWNQTVYIRGADYDQTGYEYDGVPVNRAFDNYAAHTASTLGQQELQVYTGGGPSGASANGLGGFINQVIRSGTYPAFGSVELGVGTPTFYHQFKAEVGGATSNRNFSYYLGYTGNNQNYRLYDQFTGQGNPSFTFPLVTPGLPGPAPACVNGANPHSTPVGVTNNPGCYALVTSAVGGNPALVTDREFVTNLHFAIPHKNGIKDDIQLLYTLSQLNTDFGSAVHDLGASTYLNAYGTLPNFADAYVYPPNVAFGTKATPGLKPIEYFFPSSNQHAFGAPVEQDHRDAFTNGSSIIKLQYQKNFGSNAYARLFGYTFYSDWLNNGPNIAAVGVPVNASPDYELSTHTRGLELQLADQFNAQNLLQGTFNYTTASVVRSNNRTSTASGSLTGTKTTNLVDEAGNCYGSGGALATCNGSANRGSFADPVPFAATGAAAAANAQWIVTETGYNGTFNTVKPKFSSFSLQDQFKPTDRLTLNLGIRNENFQYDLASTDTPAQNFWFAAGQREFCYNPVTLANGPKSLTCPTGFVHPNGQNGAALFENTFDPVKHNVFEPRLGFTYTINPETVLRGSYGRFAQPPNTAAVQYNTQQYNTANYIFGKFVSVGFFSPRHDIRPAISSNFDLSLEQHLKGTDISYKVSPFARSVIDQQNNVYLDQVTQFVSAINAGNVHAYGVEAQLTKGDFNRNGFAAQVSYAFTTQTIRYNNLGNSSVNVIDQINNSIKTYNGFTKKGGGSPCFANSADGTVSACGPTAVANPYYNAAPQPLLDRNGSYTPFDFTPSIFGAIQDAYYSPHVITGLLNYKHNKLTVTPSVQVNFGTLYGVPTEVLGLDPSTCTSNSAGIPTAVAAGRALSPDYTSCGSTLIVPNPETGRFDRQGEYENPTNLVGNLQLAYDVNSKVRARVTIANLVNQCFGGTPAVWANGGPKVCAYGLDGFIPTSYYSNFYNGSGPNDIVANTAPVNAYNAHSYRPVGFANPVNVYFSLDVKL